ncbi:MAG: hypothetical protein ABI588_08955 [Arenimonas sp.]
MLRQRIARRSGLLAGLALALVACLSACSDTAAPVSDAQDRDQHARARVLEAFMRDPPAAVAQYRPVWDAGLRSGASDPGSPGEYTMLAIAQGIVQNGQDDPRPFLRYAQARAHSPNPNLIEAALWVFSAADDEASLAVLFSTLPDQRGTAAMAAESVIMYRRSLSHAPARAADAARIEAGIASFCADPRHAVRPLCAYTGSGASGEPR